MKKEATTSFEKNVAARWATWHKKNPERARASKEKYRSAHREKARAVSAQWRADNPEKHKANNARWSAENRAKKRADNARWAAENPEKKRAARKKWKLENIIKVRAAIARWKKAHPERGRASSTKWQAANPEKVLANCVLRRSRKRNASTNLTNEDRAVIVEIYRQCRLITKRTGVPHHVDHKVALARGGLHHPSNLQVLTAVENRRKGARY